MTRIARRSVLDSDRDFLFRLYASTRAAEMAMVPWTEEQKQAFLQSQFSAQCRGYREMYPDAAHEIFSRDGTDAGRLYVSRETSRIHILDITVAPELRNSGIGTELMQEMIAEADRAGQPVSIYVETYNPSRRFFERLGFRVASSDGVMLLLERPASESRNPAVAAPAND